MKGLLIKDLYQMIKYCRSILIVVACFLVAASMNSSSWFFIFYPCLLCGMIPVTLLAYDERSRWDQYALTLPVTRRQIVTGKYFISAGAVILCLILSIAVAGLKTAGAGTFTAEKLVSLLSVIFVAASATSSLTLPFVFKWGVEKGRLAYYVIMGAMTAMVFLYVDYLPLTPKEAAGDVLSSSAGTVLPAAPLFLLGAAFYMISWLVSVKVYEKRELR